MKRVNWIGPESFIPDAGSVNKGDTIELPDRRADSYVNQGLAEYTDLAEIKLEHAEESDDA